MDEQTERELVKDRDLKTLEESLRLLRERRGLKRETKNGRAREYEVH